MRRLLLLLNRISLLVIIFAMGLGWYRFWPIATQFWDLFGLFVFVHWAILSSVALYLMVIFYITIWYFTRDIPFDTSLTETIHNIGLRRWITLAAITIIGTPPYLYWLAVLYCSK